MGVPCRRPVAIPELGEPIAVLGAIDGNSWALRAVLDDAKRQGIDRWCCIGNLVGLGPDPRGALDLARTAACVLQGARDWIVGRQELWAVTTHAGQQMLPWSWRQLTAEHRAWLLALPSCASLTAVDLHGDGGHSDRPGSSDRRLAIGWGPSYGSAGAVWRGLHEERLPAGVVGRPGLAGALVYPGAAWVPRHLGAAGYAIIHSDEVEFRRVRYDDSAFRAAMAALLSAEVDAATIERICSAEDTDP